MIDGIISHWTLKDGKMVEDRDGEWTLTKDYANSCSAFGGEINRLRNEMDGEILNHRAARDKLIYRESEIKLLREQLEEKNSRIDELTRKLGYRQGLCTPKPRA